MPDAISVTVKFKIALTAKEMFMKTPSKLASAISLSLLASVLLLSGCESASGSPDTEKKDVVVSIPVEASKISRGAISSTYRTTSTLEAKADAEALKIKFEVTQESPYNPEFVAKIQKSRKQAQEGKTVKIALDDIWK